jgi:hypothetical protein
LKLENEIVRVAIDPLSPGQTVLALLRAGYPALERDTSGTVTIAVLLGTAYGLFDPSCPDSPQKKQRFHQYLKVALGL